MRLKLVIKRHSLPDTPVAWAIDTSNNPTIAQLLEQVNEILPLESGGDWGLEDYAVEIKGSGTNFECLHFQQVASILHEDDEVIIRPLLSLDLKLRRVSGRKQIASDGRHLFDGAAFGRARPRGVSDRPVVEIPPRKRRRITYDGEESDSALNEDHVLEDQSQTSNNEAGNRQLVVQANFDNGDDDESEDDSDFQPEDEDGDENGDENVNSDLEEFLREGGEQSNNRASDSEDSLAHITNKDMHAKIQKLRESFPEAPIAVCQHVLVGSNGDLSGAWEALSRAFPPAKLQNHIAVTSSVGETLRSTNIRCKKAALTVKKSMGKRGGSDKYMLGEGNEDIENSVRDFVEHYDQHGLPPGSISTEASSSLITELATSKNKKKFHDSKEKFSQPVKSIPTSSCTKSVRFEEVNTVLKNFDEVELDDDDENEVEEFDGISSTDTTSTSSSDSSTDSAEDDTSSSGSDSNDRDSDSDDKAKRTSSSSSCDSGSGPEETSSKQSKKSALTSNSNTVSEELPEIATTNRHAPKAPGRGKPATRKRNVRRRIANELKRLKSRGFLPAQSTSTEFKKKGHEGLASSLESVNETEKRDSMTTKFAERAAAQQAQFMAQRNELLSSLASGGVEVGPTASSGTTSADLNVQITKTPQETKALPKKLSRTMHSEEESASLKDLNADLSITHKTQHSTVVTLETSIPKSAPTVRRKLNVGAAGRLVFGALGVRTPKTKADEEQLRRDLIRHVRPVKIASADAEMQSNDEKAEIEEDPDAWRNVITLRAVECCHDGIVLSEPPFPFVQRWDAQQQGNWHKIPKRQKHRRKRQQRDQAQYYDDEQYPAKKLTHCNEEFYDKLYEEYLSVGQDENLDMGKAKAQNPGNTESNRVGDEANDQRMKDAQVVANATNQFIGGDDLPELPNDVSTLRALVLGDLKVGMVVAYKQLTLSEETNWQPQISNYRTAQVTNIYEDGQIDLVIAWRDREFKYYNEDTGQRIFRKFDVPIDDEYDNDGLLSVPFSELLQPKLVQAPPETLAIALESSLRKAALSNDKFVRMDHDDHEVIGMNCFETAELQRIKPALSEQLLESKLPAVEVDRFKFNTAAAQPENKKDDCAHQDSSSTSIRGGNLQHLDSSPPTFFIPEDAGSEISMMMEAGFRSDVQSSVARVLAQRSISPEISSQNGPKAFLESPYSPRFNGFGSDSQSSPPVEIIFSSSLTSDNTSQLPPSAPPEIVEYDVVEDMEDVHSVSSVHYPKLSVLSSHESEIVDCGRQPDFPTPGDDTLERFEADHLLAEQNSLEKQSQVTGEDKMLLPSSIRRSANNSLTSDEELPLIKEVFATQPSQNQSNSTKKRITSSTAPVISTGWPLSQGLVDDAENLTDSHQEAIDLLDAKFNDEEEDPSQITRKASQKCTKFQLPKAEPSSQPQQAPNKNDRVGSNVYVKFGGPFIPPLGSQQVDLTLSSDVEQDPDSDRDREGDALYKDLHGDPKDQPTGPVVVANTRNRAQSQRQARHQSSLNRGLSSQGEAKTKSTRRKTTSRF